MSFSISVITVCKDCIEDLLRTKVSVENQACQDFEWIIIDGNSLDGTKALLEEIRSSRIHTCSEPDNGIYDAMNKGLKKATGERIWFMNAGDTFFDQDSLSMVVAAPDEIGICFGEAMVMDEHNRELGTRSKVSPHQTPQVLRMDDFQKGMIVSHQAFVPKRALVPMFNERQFTLSADLDWMLRILESNPSSRNLGMLCRVKRDGATMRHWYRSQIERFQILASHFGLCKTLINHVGIVQRRIMHGAKSQYWK